MGLTRPGYAVVYVILLCALSNGGSEGKRWKPEEFLNNGGGLPSPHGEKVEQAWKYGRKELIERRNADEDSDMHPVERSSDLRSAVLIKKNIGKATNFLPPHMKQNLLDCKITKTLNTPVSEGKTGSRHLLTKHWTSGHGRYLEAESPDNQMPPRSNPAKSPGTAVASPSHGPSPIHEFPFGLSLPPNMFVPFPPPPPSPHPKRPEFNPNLVYAPPLPGDDNNQQQKIIFVAAAAAVILSFLALLLIIFCCGKRTKVNPREGQKDDRPLLTLTSSKLNAGKFVGLENFEKKEYGINIENNPSTVSNLPTKPGDHNTSLAETSSECKGQVPDPPLKPPPGRTAPLPPGPPPPQPPAAPRPPPPPRVTKAPPMPPKAMPGKNKPSAPGSLGCERGSSSEGGELDAPKPKLKPFFWDKVIAKPDQAMVWHEINAGSFQFNEEMIESLFGCNNQKRNEHRKESPSLEPAVQYIQIIDPRKAQNLSILLRALNVTTEEVIDALKQGNEIPVELIHTLLKMAPTSDEEIKLRLFTGDISQLGPAERFLKVLVDIPFAFKRLQSLMFKVTLPEEVSTIKESIASLEVACNSLRKSRLFLKLLEAVLKTGNRMNDGTYRGRAQAFRLDTLLKLADVKGTDGKTTLIHFVVQEIIRSEGIRAVRTEKECQSVSSVKTEDFGEDTNDDSEEHYRSLGLQVVSGLSTELEDVKKAALIDGDGLTAAVSKLGQSLISARDFIKTDLKNLDEDSEFYPCLASFMEEANADVTWLLEEEKRIMALVKSTADYFHGNAGKDEGLRLFVIVRDFLIMLDKVCKEVKDTTIKSGKASKTEAPSVSSSPDTRQSPSDEIHRRVFPAMAERRVDYSSSDDEISSP